MSKDTQIAIMMQPKIQLFFSYFFGDACIAILASDKTISGISFIEAVINSGTIMISSNKPSTGIKSGTKSTGLNK